MKKILAFLLIAIITCEAIEEIAPIKNPFQFPFPPMDEKFRTTYQKVDEISKKYGDKTAIQYCSKYYPIKVCEMIIYMIHNNPPPPPPPKISTN